MALALVVFCAYDSYPVSVTFHYIKKGPDLAGLSSFCPRNGYP